MKKRSAIFLLGILISFGNAKALVLHGVSAIVRHFRSEETTAMRNSNTSSHEIPDDRELANTVILEKVPTSLRAISALQNLDFKVDSGPDVTLPSAHSLRTQPVANGTPTTLSVRQFTREAPPGDQDKLDGMSHGFLGPRPYIDVTAYGAKGDGLTNDTHPIQKAIDAACSKELPAGVKSGGGIYFPPGNYLISQQQAPAPTNVPDLSIPTTCSGLYFFGGNTGNRNGVVAGQTAPSSTLHVVNGPHPNGSPVFFLQQGQIGMTQGGFQSSFQNLSLNCYNQCVWIYGAAQVNDAQRRPGRRNNRVSRQYSAQVNKYFLV